MPHVRLVKRPVFNARETYTFLPIIRVIGAMGALDRWWGWAGGEEPAHNVSRDFGNAEPRDGGTRERRTPREYQFFPPA